VKSQSWTPRLIVAFATLYVVWGTTYLAIKVGLDAGLPPALFAGLRLIPAGVILLAISAARGARIRPSASQVKVLAVVGILLLVGGQYGTFLAETRIPSGLAALIVALLPLWIALAESLLPDMARPSGRGYAGLVLGFLGLAVLLLPRLAEVGAVGASVVAGMGIQIVATWLWASGSIYSKRRPTSLDGLTATGWEMLIAGAVLVALGTGLGEWSGFALTPKGLAALAYLVVFGSCIAFTAFTYALAHAQASKVMTYAFVNPVIAVFVGWLFGRLGVIPPEPVTASMIVGMAVIVAGVAMTTSAPTRPPRRPSPLAGIDEPELAAEPSEV
jgi:drug/metabolite transporter (DMT)-like permease